MGKQVIFFASNIDIENLIIEIHKNKGIIIYEDGYELNQYELSKITDIQYCRKRFRFSSFYIKIPSSNIIYDYYKNIDRKCLDQLFSDVFQFNTCRPSQYNKNWYEHGRIWYAHNYYNEEGNIINKSNDLDVFYKNVYKYIRKNYKLTLNKFAYIGPDALDKYHKGEFIPSSGINKIIVE